MRATGIRFDTPPATRGAATARCLIFVTPDAQRTMNTYLGACVSLGPEDIDDALIAKSGITYLEGYLFDPPHAKEAFIKAARIAHDAGRQVALSLSDGFCVDRHREAFQELVDHHVDILFANESEITSLYQSRDFDEAARHVRGKCGIAALTRSEKGSLILSGEDEHVIAVEPVAHVVDSTGAGDLYAAGFLQGLSHGRSLAEAGRMGAIAAAEVISHFGARPEHSLADLVQAKL
jgi:sugar/nucleoside kinase (ribokinase family)